MSWKRSVSGATGTARRKGVSTKVPADERIPSDGYQNAKSRTRCPYCDGNHVKVLDKRTVRSLNEDKRMDYSRRRRECQKCMKRWTTVEIHAAVWKIFRELIDAQQRG